MDSGFLEFLNYWMVPGLDKKLTPEIIRDTICSYFNINPDIIGTKNRNREIVDARHFIHYFTKMYAKGNKYDGSMSLREISKRTGTDKDHATIIHSIKTISNLIETDKNINKNYLILKEKFDIINRNLIKQ